MICVYGWVSWVSFSSRMLGGVQKWKDVCQQDSCYYTSLHKTVALLGLRRCHSCLWGHPLQFCPQSDLKCLQHHFLNPRWTQTLWLHPWQSLSPSGNLVVTLTSTSPQLAVSSTCHSTSALATQAPPRPSKCPKSYTNRILGEQNLRQKVRKFCKIFNRNKMTYLIKYTLTVQFSI